MGYGDPLPQSRREAELHTIYVDRAKSRMNVAHDPEKAATAERRYSALHERESARRMRIASQMSIARQINPDGGFWYVDDSARAHCPTCEARGGRNYTWDQLDAIDPTLNHSGCRCSILPALQHGKWAPKYNALTEALIQALVKRGSSWVVIHRDDASHFPQHFAGKDSKSSPGAPRRPRGGAISGPLALKPGEKFSGESYLSGLSQAKKKMLLKLGSYEVIGDLVGCTPAVAKRVLGGKLEMRYRPSGGQKLIDHAVEIRNVAEKIGLIPDRALLQIEKDAIRERSNSGEITPAQYVVRRKQIEDVLSTRPRIRERGDRKQIAETPPPSEPAFGTAAADYALQHVEKPKPRGTKYPKSDEITQRIMDLHNAGRSLAEIKAILGGPSGFGVKTETEANHKLRDAVEKAARRAGAEKAATTRGTKRLEKLDNRVELEKALSDSPQSSDTAGIDAAIASILGGDAPTSQIDEHARLTFMRVSAMSLSGAYTAVMDEFMKPARNRLKQWGGTPEKAAQGKRLIDSAAAEMRAVNTAAKKDDAQKVFDGIMRAAQFLSAFDDYALQNDGRRKATT